MDRTMTFGRKLAIGLSIKAALTVVLAAVAVSALQYVADAKDQVIDRDARLLREAYHLEGIVLERMGTVRAYVLTGDESLKPTIVELGGDFFALLDSMRPLLFTQEERAALDRVAQLAKTQFDAGDGIVRMRDGNTELPAIGRAFQDKVVPVSVAVRKHLNDFIALQSANLAAAKSQAEQTSEAATILVIVIAAITVLAAVVLAIFLTRLLRRQIGSAVQHITSSSSELQAAANQQATGTKEQVASMTEISTIIKQLMSTAHQIAQSAQGVARIAENATAASGSGRDTVEQAQSDVAMIRKQVDAVVEHMLDLGSKAQQIGGILEIINELTEQTNILAINAAIEAAGAGEAGARFAVVAEEIRKLADRVGGSTREIRTLVEQIRSAMNAAVMATEGGSKAVDAGSRQFDQVAAAFRRISDLLGTTAEAAREIELSTKQQSTAVEQAGVAVANVAQTAREAEASSNQVLQTVAELTTLSRDLGQLVQPQSQE